MSTAANFKAFCENLAVENQEDISRRYRLITRRLNEDFWNRDSTTAHSLFVGSYGRNTAINGISDLDMLFELPKRLHARFKAHRGKRPIRSPSGREKVSQEDLPCHHNRGGRPGGRRVFS